MHMFTTDIPPDEREELSAELAGNLRHDSDCAVYNAPAYDPKPCDCGAQLKAERRYAAYLCRRGCNRVERWRMSLFRRTGWKFLLPS